MNKVLGAVFAAVLAVATFVSPARAGNNDELGAFLGGLVIGGVISQLQNHHHHVQPAPLAIYEAPRVIYGAPVVIYEAPVVVYPSSPPPIIVYRYGDDGRGHYDKNNYEWVDKGEFERRHGMCQGPIRYADGRYWCKPR